MTDTTTLSISEDRIPPEGIEEAIEELVEMYGGEINDRQERSRNFTLPLRRGVPTSGAVACHLTWEPAEGESGELLVNIDCDRAVDAPRLQRVLLLVAGLVGSFLFMLWPFFPNQKGYGTLAWVGGAIAIAVYFMSLRKTSGGIVHDFLQRLAVRQREAAMAGEHRAD